MDCHTRFHPRELVSICRWQQMHPPLVHNPQKSILYVFHIVCISCMSKCLFQRERVRASQLVPNLKSQLQHAETDCNSHIWYGKRNRYFVYSMCFLYSIYFLFCTSSKLHISRIFKCIFHREWVRVSNPAKTVSSRFVFHVFHVFLVFHVFHNAYFTVVEFVHLYPRELVSICRWLQRYPYLKRERMSRESARHASMTSDRVAVCCSVLQCVAVCCSAL